jgi:hypothetical protein
VTNIREKAKGARGNLPNQLLVSHPEHVIRLDTAAFRVARTARVARGLAYWIVLAVAAAGVAVAIAVATTMLGHRPTVLHATASQIALADAPAPETTPVTVWNASPVDGAANRLKIRLSNLGYPAEAAKSHGLPKGGLKGTWIFYTPGNSAAARGVAANLEVNAARRVRPVDGIRPEQLAPAVVLVVVGR